MRILRVGIAAIGQGVFNNHRIAVNVVVTGRAIGRRIQLDKNNLAIGRGAYWRAGGSVQVQAGVIAISDGAVIFRICLLKNSSVDVCGLRPEQREAGGRRRKQPKFRDKRF